MLDLTLDSHAEQVEGDWEKGAGSKRPLWEVADECMLLHLHVCWGSSEQLLRYMALTWTFSDTAAAKTISCFSLHFPAGIPFSFLHLKMEMIYKR